MRTISIQNKSTVVGPADFAAAIPALAIQVARDFAPWWACAGNVQVTTNPAPEQILILDNTDQADALGYHDLAAGDNPVGYVFAKTCQQYGEAWTATLSHELLEQIVDPFCTAMIEAPWAGRVAALAYEVADAVENQEYPVNGVKVSNFCTPYWFLAGALPAGAKADFLGLARPLTLTHGGYMSYTLTLRTWLQSFAERTPEHQRHVGRYSRRHRRHYRRVA